MAEHAGTEDITRQTLTLAGIKIKGPFTPDGRPTMVPLDPDTFLAQQGTSGETVAVRTRNAEDPVSLTLSFTLLGSSQTCAAVCAALADCVPLPATYEYGFNAVVGMAHETTRPTEEVTNEGSVKTFTLLLIGQRKIGKSPGVPK